MRRIVAVILFAAFCSCAKSRFDSVSSGAPAETFTLLAGSELKDVETKLKPAIRAATGLDLAFTYSGTLQAVERLGRGEHFDALWVSHGKYLAMNNGLKGRILAQEKTMLSPVLLGLKSSKARELGWDREEPTWKQISDAAREEKFTFGMTNPAASNTGLTATIGLAAALAKRPDTLTQADLQNPLLAGFFHAQRLTSGSSGWLAEAYQHDQTKVDGIINYESVLLSLNAGGQLSEPLTLVYPKEGIITADYPLMLLSESKRASYNKLVEYLRGREFQSKMSAATLRRPVNADAIQAGAIPKRILVELPFPGEPALIDSLVNTFLADLRIPGSSRYLLDLSGSMEGPRLASLKEAMLMLASGTPADSQRYARFQNREEIGIIPFSGRPGATRLFQMGSTKEQNAQARAGVAEFIQPLVTDGSTAIYASLEQALGELGRERAEKTGKGYYTIVLMTDGENNRSPGASEFREWYRAQGASVRAIPVFAILFGEGNAKALGALADLTGGRVFDSRATTLTSVFQEIRGYQ